MSAPRKLGLSANAKHTANEVANGDAYLISKPTFGSRGDVGAARRPPLPTQRIFNISPSDFCRSKLKRGTNRRRTKLFAEAAADVT